MSKKSVMSLSIDPHLEDLIKREAKQEGISTSKFVCNLIQKFVAESDKVTIVEHNEDYIPVVLKVPTRLRGTDQVRNWLSIRMNALGDKLSLSGDKQ
jgi:hypothetical protein